MTLDRNLLLTISLLIRIKICFITSFTSAVKMVLTLVENLKKGDLSKETKRGSLSLTKSTYSLIGTIVLAVKLRSR